MMASRHAHKKLFLCFAAAMLGVAAMTCDGKVEAGGQDAVSFNRDIRPIFSDTCFRCHGPDQTSRQAGLRLDAREEATKKTKSGVIPIVPGKPEESEVVRRIFAAEKYEVMPPPASHKELTAQQKEIIKRWIAEGARYESHWAFQPIRRPAVPARFKGNPIDAFIEARLAKEGLRLAREADRQTLIRRLSFDLTGLPPTLKEIDDFLNDQAPNAYEKVVDRLLASPRYGERMAFRWLDAARYADTNGYQIDGERSMWRWRDWVIESFNQNKPFDQFVIEQLAGDLLPNPTLDQKIATAFNRHHRINAEGGIVPEEYAVEYVVDRVDTTSTVLMGLTVGCARCHDHKYDPITQKEYYQLYAYFNNIREDGRAYDQDNSAPWIAAPDREQQRKVLELENQIARAEARLAAMDKRLVVAKRRWEKSLLSRPDQQWFPDRKLLARLSMDEGGAPVINKSDRPYHNPPEASKRGGQPDLIGFRNGNPKYLAAPTGQGVAFDGSLVFEAGQYADFGFRDLKGWHRERFAISAWFYAESENSGAIVTRMRDDIKERENGLPRGGGWGLFFNNGKIHFNIVRSWGDDGLRVETERSFPLRNWHHALVAFDGTQPYDLVSLYVDGRKQPLKFNQSNFYLLFKTNEARLRIGGGGGPDLRFKGALDEVRVYATLPEADETAILSCADSLRQIAALKPERRTWAQRLKLRYAFLSQAAPAPVSRLWSSLAELKEARIKLQDEIPTLMVMEEMAEPKPAFLLKRGAYDAPADKVEREVPAALPPMPREFPNNRLGLAMWLLSPEHPLTARVQVNHLWEMLFGAGLVKTAEDFGSRGELPSHPELLEWLAAEFRDGATERRSDGAMERNNPQSAIHNPQSKGWDTKALLKTIVMSATYRQSSESTPQLLQKDPENRLIGRGRRQRLSADMIRDQALFVSGLLVEKLGGPSVRPYQPDGLYKDMAFSFYPGYKSDKGEGLWRRSLYSYWKRTILSPGMQVFDASSREFCRVREVRTNTPLQALNLMNDVTYVEAARMLARRMIVEGGRTAEERLAWAVRAATSRWPNEKELQVLLRNLKAQADYFTKNPQEAARLLAVGEKPNDQRLNKIELAAYAATASLIMNLDEVITKQ